jgi:hypothetical protein
MRRIRYKDRVYLLITWEELDKLVKILSNKIKSSNYKVDIIVGVLRGGAIIANLIADSLSIDKVVCIGIKKYDVTGKQLRTIKYQDIDKGLVKAKNVLLADDVCETGETLRITCDEILLKGAKEVKSACIHLKPHSKFVPDYYSRRVKSWIIYPYEIRSFFKAINKKIPYL